MERAAHRALLSVGTSSAPASFVSSRCSYSDTADNFSTDLDDPIAFEATIETPVIVGAEHSDEPWLQGSYMSWAERISGGLDADWEAASRSFATPLA